MPIKGLTDRNEGAFPQIGIIRKGAPKTQNAPGRDLAHFRVEFDDKETEAASAFARRFGKEPTDIIIVLPFNEIERCWEAWRETYIAGAMTHRCDGEVIQYAINPRTGEKLVVNGIGLDGRPVRCAGKSDGCKPIGRLRVIVPELQRLAYLVVMTTSIHDIINISEQLEGISSMNGGRLAGIPLILRRRPKKISTPSGEAGKRARREKWLISIEADPEWVRTKLAKMHHDALPGNGFDVKELPTPINATNTSGPNWGDDDDDGSENEGEFTPTESVQPIEPTIPITSLLAQEQSGSNGSKHIAAWPAEVITWAKEKWNIAPQQIVGALKQSMVLMTIDNADTIKHWLEIRKAERDNGIESAEASARADADLIAILESHR